LLGDDWLLGDEALLGNDWLLRDDASEASLVVEDGCADSLLEELTPDGSLSEDRRESLDDGEYGLDKDELDMRFPST
jgi:hypothetical protein